MYKIWKYFEKGQVIAYDYHTQKTARIGPDNIVIKKVSYVPT